MKLHGDSNYKEEEQSAFQLLRNGLLGAMPSRKNQPRLDVYSDQIVWGRSPVRIDLAGGWQIPLPTLSIREEVLSTWLSN